jgi:hypothetical protein
MVAPEGKPKAEDGGNAKQKDKKEPEVREMRIAYVI